MPQITVDGRAYDTEKLSDPARQQVLNLTAVDEEIRRLQTKLVIYQTARNSYAAALKSELPKDD
jgi:hypothetical protein